MAYRDGGIHTVERTVETEDGVKEVEITSSALRDGSGNIVAGIEVVRDITVRRRTEVERNRLAMAVDQSAEAIVVTDLEGTIQYVNPAFERITGYSKEEAVGKNPRVLGSGKHDESFYKEMWGVLGRGEVWVGHFINRKKDGSLYEEDATISPVRDSSGNIVSFVAVKRDVTRIVTLEKQVRMSQKMESVGTLAGGIAHDFNNVLTVIVGFGEMLKHRIANDPKAVSDLDEILRGAERAAVLTRQLLTFARRQVVAPVNLDLNQVVADLEKLLRKVTREDMEIKVFHAENTVMVRADRGQVEQVIMNLCLNARDAMPEGGRLLIETGVTSLEEGYLERYPYMKAGRYAVLSVNDTGIGMDERTRERIFEPFFTTKGPDKGTGLGLAMVYGIVKQHDGFIHVYSEPGKGTTFRVYFPAADAPADAREIVPQGVARGGNETILLAEDNESVRHLTEEVLTSYGYRVLVACDGEEAIEIFRRHGKEIAMLVLDVVMPKMGGKQAYGEIAKMAPGLKALYLSGYSANAIHESFVLLPGVSFLQKPFAPNALARKVREVLDRM
jgi:PAS domain S-box-containing protein